MYKINYLRYGLTAAIGLLFFCCAWTQRITLSVYGSGEWALSQLEQVGEPEYPFLLSANYYDLEPIFRQGGHYGIRADIQVRRRLGVLTSIDLGRADYEFHALDFREQIGCDLCLQSRIISYTSPKIDFRLAPQFSLLASENFNLSVHAGLVYSYFTRDGATLHSVDRPREEIYVRNVNTISRAFTRNVWKATAGVDFSYRRFGLGVGYRHQFTNNTPELIELDIPSGGAAYRFRSHTLVASLFFKVIR